MTCGIYKLEFKGTPQCYIGKSINIEYRYKGHLRSFIRGESSKKMRIAYSMYGIPDLVILVECHENDLDKYENLMIQQYEAVLKGFNTHNTATGFTRETSGELNHKSKYSNASIIECMNILVEYPDMLFSEIEEITGIPRGSVSMIAYGGNHKWLKDYDPTKYTKMMGMIGNRKTSCKSALKQGILYPNILSPEDVIYTVNNAREFARQHGLDQSALGRVLNKKAITHKGWRLSDA